MNIKKNEANNWLRAYPLCKALCHCSPDNKKNMKKYEIKVPYPNERRLRLTSISVVCVAVNTERNTTHSLALVQNSEVGSFF